MLENIFLDEYDLKDKFYYYFDFEEEAYINILKKGIKSKILRGIFTSGYSYNGLFYISLLKLTNEENLLSLLNTEPLLVIDKNVKPILTTRKKVFECLSDSIFFPRYSPYSNEYQRLLKVSPAFIKALSFYLEEKNIKENLEFMQKIIELEKNNNIELPFVDRKSKKIIDKTKILQK